MSSDTDAVKCPVLLSAEQWPLWQMRINSKLNSANVRGFAFGEVPHYTSHDGSSNSPSIYPSVSSSVSSHSCDSWEARDNKALSIIQDHMHNQLAIEFSALRTSKLLMDALIAKFQGTNTGPRAFLAFKAMVDSKWDGIEDISALVSRLRIYQQTLTALGFPLDDTIYAFILLYTLPDNPKNAQLWSQITSSVAKGDVLTFSHVEAHFTTNALIHAAGKALSTSTATASESALSVIPSRSSQARFVCSHHGENGSHNTSECFALKKLDTDKKKKGYKGKGKAKTEGYSAQEETSEYEEDEMAGAAVLGQTRVATVSAKSKWNINAYVSSEPDTARKLLLDSGASSTMVPYIEWFEPKSLKALNPPRPIGFGDDSEVFAVAIGTIHLNTKSGTIHLTNVLLVPEFVISLISVSKLAKYGLRSTFDYGTAKVLKDGKTVLRATQKGGTYCIMAEAAAFATVAGESAHTVVDVNTMHRRFGHLNFQSLTKMVNSGQVKGVKHLSGKPQFCEPCHLGKHKLLSLKTQRQRATRPFQLIHCDIGGPVTP